MSNLKDLKKISDSLKVSKDRQKSLLTGNPVMRKLFNIPAEEIKKNRQFENRIKISYSRLDEEGNEVPLIISRIHKDERLSSVDIPLSSFKDSTITIIDSSSGNTVKITQRQVMFEDKVIECNFVFLATKIYAEADFSGTRYIVF